MLAFAALAACTLLIVFGMELIQRRAERRYAAAEQARQRSPARDPYAGIDTDDPSDRER